MGELIFEGTAGAATAVSATNPLPVTSTAGEGIADDAAFTVGTSKVLPVGFLADETSPDSVNEGDIGAARMTLDRQVRVYSGPSPQTPTSYRSAVIAADVLAAPGTVTCTKQAGGNCTGGAYNVKVVAGNVYGRTTATAGNTAITTETTNLTVRAAFAQVTGATYYDIYCTTDAQPLFVGRVTEAQRAAGVRLDAVNVVSGDRASEVAAKIKTALTGDTDVSGAFNIGGTGADITLTDKQQRADDATLNIAIANGTCAGLTAAPTSADTTPGQAGVAAQVETATVVGTITASGNVTVTVTAANVPALVAGKAINVAVLATGGAAGAVDIGAIGTGLAAGTTAAVNTAYSIPASPVSCAGYTYCDFDITMSRSGDSVAPSLVVVPYLYNSRTATYYARDAVTVAFGGTTGAYGPLKQRIRVEVRGNSAVALVVQSIAGTGASVDIDATLN